MTSAQAAAVRYWAIAQGMPGVGQRGPIGYDAHLAYAKAHGLPEPARCEKKLPAPTRRPRRDVLTSCTCGRRWEGLTEAHCPRCHRHFRSVDGFDAHIVLAGRYSEDTVCRDPLDIRYQSGARKGHCKYRVVEAHHGPLFTTAEEYPAALKDRP